MLLSSVRALTVNGFLGFLETALGSRVHLFRKVEDARLGPSANEVIQLFHLLGLRLMLQVHKPHTINTRKTTTKQQTNNTFILLMETGQFTTDAFF
jgi:hypothetical protein